MNDAPSPHLALIVEDQPQMSKLVTMLLQARGFEAVVAETAAAALELCKERKPVLALIDLSLPDLPGDKLLARLKSQPDPPACFLYSGIDASELAELAEAAGADGFLVKPFSLETFSEALAGFD